MYIRNFGLRVQFDQCDTRAIAQMDFCACPNLHRLVNGAGFYFTKSTPVLFNCFSGIKLLYFALLAKDSDAGSSFTWKV